MSHKLNMLNSANNQRNGKYSLAVSREETPKINYEPRKLEQNVSTTNLKLIIGSVFLIIMVFNLALTFKLLVTLNKMASDRNNSIEQIEELETLVSKNGNGIQKINDDLQAVTAKTKSISTKVEQAQETNESQAAAIENLNKAKNTLFNKRKAPIAGSRASHNCCRSRDLK